MKKDWQKTAAPETDGQSVPERLIAMSDKYTALSIIAKTAFEKDVRNLYETYFAPATVWNMWDDRPAKPPINPAQWIIKHHGDIIGSKGARAAIGRRDPNLIQAYAQWISPERHPEDDLGLDTRSYTDLSAMSAQQTREHRKAQQRSSAQRCRANKPKP